MKKEDLDYLNDVATKAMRGDMSALANPRAAGLVLAMVSHHEEIVRGEAFWGERAPKLNDELLALRPIEAPARIVANGGELSGERIGELRAALEGLDAVRAAQAKAAEVAP